MQRSGLIKRRKSLREYHQDKLRRKQEFPNNWGSKPRKPLKKMARARKTDHQRYMAAFPAWVAKPENSSCAICIVLKSLGGTNLINPTTERHHFRGRHHKLLCWEPGWIPSCRFHREWPHDPATRPIAEEHGIIASSTDFDTYPPELRNA